MTWREYHEATKHTAESLRRTQYVSTGGTCPIRSGITRAYRFSTCRRTHRPLRSRRSHCFRARMELRPRGWPHVPIATAVLLRGHQRIKARPIHRRPLCAACESVLRQSASDRIPLPDSRPRSSGRTVCITTARLRTWPSSVPPVVSRFGRAAVLRPLCLC